MAEHTKIPYEDSPTLAVSTGRNTSSQPNAFVMYSSGLARAQYSCESVNTTDEETSKVVLTTWDSFSEEDRAQITQEAERADELHLAMLGSEKMGARGQIQKEKYWSFTARMTDIWFKKWNKAQAAVKAHLKRRVKDLPMGSVDPPELSGSGEPDSPSRPVTEKGRGPPECEGSVDLAESGSSRSPGSSPRAATAMRRGSAEREETSVDLAESRNGDESKRSSLFGNATHRGTPERERGAQAKGLGDLRGSRGATSSSRAVFERVLGRLGRKKWTSVCFHPLLQILRELK
jgi:hypothetical protein